MYFGEFLLHQKAITEEQLLDALIYQVEHLPSFLRVLKSENLLSSAEIMKLVKMQYENSSDLLKVIRSEKKLSEDSIADLYQIQASKRKMLGAVLVELNILDASSVEKLLHEYLREKGQLEKVQRTSSSEQPRKEKSGVAMSDAAIESLKELGLWSEELADTSPAKVSSSEVEAVVVYNIFTEEYLNIYNEKMEKKLIKIVTILNETLENDGDIENYMSSLYKDLYILAGASRLAGLEHSNKILSSWNDIIEKIISKNDTGKLKTWIIFAIPNLTSSFKCLWELRQSIFKKGNESEVEGNNDLIKRVDDIVNILKEFKLDK